MCVVVFDVVCAKSFAAAAAADVGNSGGDDDDGASHSGNEKANFNQNGDTLFFYHFVRW